ncbi:Reverse transcriptase (RNA-dependent DNA polymerase) [Popillia japonica]|uniref:Reverse transcriptase (RNA-dependent DNA polymerase) n=1 Tax=Popillia japonica TaxID=7064 RepID=A0AAW1MGX6_POPJA
MDPRDLNKYLKSEHYALPTIESVLSDLHGAQYFSVLDAAMAFLQVPLDNESSKLCTIATPFGRFVCKMCKTIPYGISSAPEVYQKIINQIFDGLEDIIPYMDDILIYGKSQEEHSRRPQVALSRAKKYNLHFSKTKLTVSEKNKIFRPHSQVQIKV